MGRKSRQKKERRKVEHPTIFVFDGTIRHYTEGSMFSLRAQVTPNEWEQMVKETIEYRIFLECLKETAFPILKERWSKVDDWWRLQLGIAIDRMKELDPAIFLGINHDGLKAKFTEKIKKNAESVVSDIKLLRETQNSFGDLSQVDVSEL